VKIGEHFSDLAPRYKSLRTTDHEPICYIGKILSHINDLKIADIGCGDGRYDELLLKYLDNIKTLYCVDNNADMLKSLNKSFLEKGILKYEIINSSAEKLPFKESCLDVIVSFNAIHHFDLSKFLDSAKNVLKKNGYIFLYSRTKEQNKRNIWGKYFPRFNEKEIRIYSLQDIINCVDGVEGLFIESLKEFKYKRASTLERLVFLAENRHYSTFLLYSPEEFKESLRLFKDNIGEKFKSKVNWYDFNIMAILRKS